METHSSILAWRIPWTGEPGGLPSIVSHRVRCDRSDLTHTYINILEWVTFPPPKDLPDPGIEPTSPASQVDSLPLRHQGSPIPEAEYLTPKETESRLL